MAMRVWTTENSKNSLFFRYSIFDAFTALPPLFGPQATGDTPSRAGKGDSRNQSMVLGDVHIFSGTAINEFRASGNDALCDYLLFYTPFGQESSFSYE